MSSSVSRRRSVNVRVGMISGSIGGGPSWVPASTPSVALTTIYQWGWVIKFLSTSDLSLAMGIFLVFAIASFVSLTLSRRASGGVLATLLDRTTVAASAMPLLFAVFLAAVPRYGAHGGLLFGFLLIVVGGL